MLSILIFAFALAVFASFICSMCESGMLSLRRVDVSRMEEEGRPAGRAMASIKSNVGMPLAAILTVNTIANMMGAAEVGAQAEELWGGKSTLIVSGVLTVTILILGEIIPKTLGTRNAVQLAGFNAVCIRIMTVVTYPVVILLQQVSRMLGPEAAVRTTREDVAAFAKVGHTDGAIEDDEAILIANVLAMDNTPVSKILIPWNRVTKVSEALLVKELLEPGRDRVFTRMPLWDGEGERVSGFVHIPEVLEEIRHERLDRPLRDLGKPLPTVSSDTPLDEAFDDAEMVVVSGQDDAVLGIATLDDGLRFLYTNKPA